MTNVRRGAQRPRATLWAALLIGDPALFQVGLAGVVLRQALDIVANALDRRFWSVVPYVESLVPTAAALGLTF